MKIVSNAAFIKRQTVTSSVAEELRRRIVTGRYRGGEQIRQEAVAAELGVSRIPIREALLQLESEGLVVIHTHKGAMVASLSVEDAIDLFEARLVLESILIRKAVLAATPGDVARIGRCLADYERAVKNGAEPEVLSRLNWAFHTALCEPAGRPRMMTIVLSLYAATDRYLRLQIDQPEAKIKAVEDHRGIFEAFKARQSSAASRLIKAHIAGAHDDVLVQLRNPGVNGTRKAAPRQR